MCGLFGAIGKNIDSRLLRALALVNRERGTHGMGLFDSHGHHVKTGEDALEALQDPKLESFLQRKTRWFLAGHTRYATRGKKIGKNAHPFKYGKILGSHNGMVGAPKKYAVDSEYLIDRLNQTGGDYQTALASISGYWALTWFDGLHFYMQCVGNQIAIGAIGKTFYYSSTAEHLRAATGLQAEVILTDCETIRFAADCKLEWCTPIKLKAVEKFSVWETTDKKLLPLAKPGYSNHGKMVSYYNSEYDDLAIECGYLGLRDMAQIEGIREAEAMDMLDKWDGYAIDKAEDHARVWEEYLDEHK